MTDVKFFKKDFLNKDGFQEDASIYSKVAIETSDSVRASWWDATLKIRDCSQTVTLDLPSSELDNNLHKLDTLIEHLMELRKAIRIHGTEYLKNKQDLKENEVHD